jgi:hypothetical protein
MTSSTRRRSWRIIPSTFVEHHVERLAREENRSLSNMCETLLRTVIHQKLQSEARGTEHTNLIAAIRGQTELRP